MISLENIKYTNESCNETQIVWCNDIQRKEMCENM